jgi:phosphohistidine phosphatase
VKRLWLLRHAKSSWEDTGLADADRPLSPRGEASAMAMATYLAASDVRPELVLCSPARRARQTLGAVLPDLGDRIEVRVEPDLYTFDGDAVFARLRTIDDTVTSVLVVGHNPAFQELALMLTSTGRRRPEVELKFPTGALATIDLPADSWSGVQLGAGSLVDLVTPRALEG